MAWVLSPGVDKKYSLPVVALLSLIALILINLIVLNPHGFPVSYFIVSYGLSGFLVFSVLNKKNIVSVFRIIIVIFCLLSIWSLIQYFFSIGKFKPNSISAGVIFANPNSYAAVLNIILLPLITIYLLKEKSRPKYLYIVILMLFSSLITTQSRGAWFAFIAGFVFLTVLIAIIEKYLNYISIKKLIYGFIITFIMISSGKFLVLTLPYADMDYENNTVDVVENNFDKAVANKGKASFEHRKELLLVAWKNIKENKLFGVGYYNTIYYYYKDVKSYVYTKTHYIHNDYFQIWLELGILGLIIFLLIVMTIYWQGIKSLSYIAVENKVWVIALLSGLTTVFIHALVSYVFYVPVLMLLVSGYIAVLNNIIIKNDNIFFINISRTNIVSENAIFKTRVKRSIVSLVVLTYLSLFVFSQICFRAGKLMLFEGNIEQASTLFNLARELSPAEKSNYLVEAAFWKDKAFENNSHEAAVRADELYKKLMLQNEYDSDSRLHRAILHRDGYMLFNKPVSKEVILGWLEEALSWRPHHNILQAEYLRTLKKYGRIREARILLAKYLKRYPRSKSLASVREEILN